MNIVVYRIYTRGKHDKRFRGHWFETDSFERLDEMLTRIVRLDNEEGRRGTSYQIRKGKEVIREVWN